LEKNMKQTPYSLDSLASGSGALRRRTLIAGGSLCWLPAALAAYPEWPVRVLVPWPPGGVVDLPARLVFRYVQQSAGQPFMIVNKTGAGGAIGADVVAKASPDGQTLLVTTSAMNINDAMQIKQPFHPIRDFEPVALLGNAPGILVVTPSRGVKSVAELVALAKRQPGKLSFASAGNGSPAHLAGEWFKSLYGIEVVHVAYKGAPAAMIDQMSGVVDFHFANAAVALPQIRAGKVQPLAVGSPQRLSYLPDVPTMAESGAPGFDTNQWIGLLAPAKTPRSVVDKLAHLVDEALRNPVVRSSMEKNGIVPAEAGGSPDGFRKIVVGDLARWTAVVKTANIKAE